MSLSPKSIFLSLHFFLVDLWTILSTHYYISLLFWASDDSYAFAIKKNRLMCNWILKQIKHQKNCKQLSFLHRSHHMRLTQNIMLFGDFIFFLLAAVQLSVVCNLSFLSSLFVNSMLSTIVFFSSLCVFIYCVILWSILSCTRGHEWNSFARASQMKT